MLGLSFKENCPDFRNTRVIDVINHLSNYKITPVIVDPLVSADDVMHQYGFSVIQSIPSSSCFDAVILELLITIL